MYDNFREKEQYGVLMDKLKLQNREYLQMKNDSIVQKAMLMERVGYSISHLDVGMAKRYLVLKKQSAIIKKLENRKNRVHSHETSSHPCDFTSPNYFSKDRIAVYMVMFGDYDIIKEPVVVPDNADFYLITDTCNINKQSKWTLFNTDRWEEYTIKLDAQLKNRWFKTHPHLLFPTYKYSLYVDASVKIITDVTEHINKIGKSGIAMHKHDCRDCVYDELDIVRICKKDNVQNFDKMEKLYKNINFPKHYGLLEGCIIARRHNEDNVIRIMEDWWKYIALYSRRDQLSLPVALYNSGINIDEVCKLGNSVNENFAFRKESHLSHYEYIKSRER